VSDPSHDGQADDAARWWRAYQLAENDRVDELRGLAAVGDDHASRQLASCIWPASFLKKAAWVNPEKVMADGPNWRD
jgi:hypothetical protein